MKITTPRLRPPAPRQPNIAPLTVGVRAACMLTGLGQSMIYKLANEGRIESRIVCGRRLISYRSLAEFVGEARPQANQAAA